MNMTMSTLAGPFRSLFCEWGQRREGELTSYDYARNLQLGT